MDTGAWRATFHRVTKSQPCTTEDVHSDTIAELLSSLGISEVDANMLARLEGKLATTRQMLANKAEWGFKISGLR